MGQAVLAPPPPEFMQQAPPSFIPTGTNLLATMPPLTPAPSATVPEWLDWGPVRLRPHVLERFLYGDGIPARRGEQFKTAINEFSPGMALELGNHWRLDYTPTLRFYSSSQFRDTLDHSVLFSGGTTYDDWSLGLSHTFASSSQPLAETASQTDQETYVTALSAAYHMSSKMSLELGLNQNFRFVAQNQSAQQLNDSREWSTLDWLNYQFWPRFGAAIGVGFGYVNVSAGSDMTYEQLQGRINWRAGEKLSFVLNAGFDERQFIDANAPDLLNPIFGLSALYQLTETTTLSATASRAVSASYFQNQVTETTDLSGTLRQRFFGKLYLDLTGGYRVTTYEATIRTAFFLINLNREDDYVFFNARLTATILKRGTAAIFYQASDNSSNVSGFKYSSNQVGLELGYRL